MYTLENTVEDNPSDQLNLKCSILLILTEQKYSLVSGWSEKAYLNKENAKKKKGKNGMDQSWTKFYILHNNSI